MPMKVYASVVRRRARLIGAALAFIDANESRFLAAPYRPGPDGQLRPYLLLTLIGLKPGPSVSAA